VNVNKCERFGGQSFS